MAERKLRAWQFMRKRRIQARAKSAEQLVEGLIKFLKDVSSEIDEEEVEFYETMQSLQSNIKLTYDGTPFKGISVDIKIDLDDS